MTWFVRNARKTRCEADGVSRLFAPGFFQRLAKGLQGRYGWEGRHWFEKGGGQTLRKQGFVCLGHTDGSGRIRDPRVLRI